MSINIKGNWLKGLAFDVHTLSSTYLGPNQFGHDQYDTTRSDMGELVYLLKNKGDKSVVPKIVALLEKIKQVMDLIDYLVPVPSTNKERGIQPVPAITKALGKRHNIPMLDGLIVMSQGVPELKNVDDPDERLRLLKERMSFSGSHNVKGSNILLIDDLYRSGATLRVATQLLYEQGKVANVSVLAMTKTRRKR